MVGLSRSGWASTGAAAKATVTAWTQRPEDEHRLLSAILATFIRHEVLPESALPQALRDLGSPVSVLIAYPPPEDRQV